MSDEYTSTTGAGKQGASTAERLFSESINFLKQLRSNGPWVLTAITPDGPTITVTVWTGPEVNSFLCEHDGKRNIYYSVNPTKKAVTSKAKKQTSPPSSIRSRTLIPPMVRHRKLRRLAI